MDHSTTATAWASTRRLLDRRSRGYRTLVVAVVLIGLAAAAVALALWDWKPLLGGLLVVPLVGTGLTRDARLVAGWRRQVLAAWAAGRLDLANFRDAFTSIKPLPARTLAGLFDPLPVRQPPAPALADAVQSADRTAVRGMILGTAGVTVIVAAVGAAAAVGSAWPLAAVPLGLALSRFARRQIPPRSGIGPAHPG